MYVVAPYGSSGVWLFTCRYIHTGILDHNHYTREYRYEMLTIMGLLLDSVPTNNSMELPSTNLNGVKSV